MIGFAEVMVGSAWYKAGCSAGTQSLTAIISSFLLFISVPGLLDRQGSSTSGVHVPIVENTINKTNGDEFRWNNALGM